MSARIPVARLEPAEPKIEALREEKGEILILHSGGEGGEGAAPSLVQGIHAEGALVTNGEGEFLVAHGGAVDAVELPDLAAAYGNGPIPEPLFVRAEERAWVLGFLAWIMPGARVECVPCTRGEVTDRVLAHRAERRRAALRAGEALRGAIEEPRWSDLSPEAAAAAAERLRESCDCAACKARLS